MKTRWISFLLSCPLLTGPALEAQVDTLWTRSYGGAGWDYGYGVQQTADGGFVVVGTSGADYAHNADLLLIKTDAGGQAEWTRSIGRSHDHGSDAGRSVQQTDDGGYVATGSSSLPEDPNLRQVYLVRTDMVGDTLWTRTYGGPGSDGGESVQQTEDGGFAVTGWTYPRGDPACDAFLLKTDMDGALEWYRTFGGRYDDVGYAVREVSDGGFVVAGYTCSPSDGAHADACLVRTGPSGTLKWERTYGGPRNDLARSVLESVKGGFIVAGCTESFGLGKSDVYLIRTDAAGDTVWTRTFGGYGDDTAAAVAESDDGRIGLAGGTNSFGPGDSDVYLIEIDPMGRSVWSCTFGGPLDEFSNDFALTSDGGYVIAGDVGSRYGEFWDVCLIRTTPSPVGIADIPSPSTSGAESAVFHPNYPNPFNPSTTIIFEIPDDGRPPLEVRLSVYDTRGRRVRSLIHGAIGGGWHGVVWDGRNDRNERVASGVYLARLSTGVGTLTRKMTLLR